MSFGVRLLLGALAVGGGVDSTHHRSASFWSDLDDGSSVPKGAEGSSPSALPRLSREVVVPIIAVSLNTDSAPSPGGSIETAAPENSWGWSRTDGSPSSSSSDSDSQPVRFNPLHYKTPSLGPSLGPTKGLGGSLGGALGGFILDDKRSPRVGIVSSY